MEEIVEEDGYEISFLGGSFSSQVSVDPLSLVLSSLGFQKSYQRKWILFIPNAILATCTYGVSMDDEWRGVKEFIIKVVVKPPWHGHEKKWLIDQIKANNRN